MSAHINQVGGPKSHEFLLLSCVARLTQIVVTDSYRQTKVFPKGGGGGGGGSEGFLVT